LIGAAAAAASREAASPAVCQAAAAQPGIAQARAAQQANPGDLGAVFHLADSWSDAGCFGDALNVLQRARAAHPSNAELETRLRVAKSLVGEEQFFDTLDRADAEVRLKRATFRCTSMADVESCKEASRLKPDDTSLLVAEGDALLVAKQPAEALAIYRRATALSPDLPGLAAKTRTAQAQIPAIPPVTPAAATARVLQSPASPVATRPRGAHTLAPAARTTGQIIARRYSNSAADAQTH
jgi:tetratricopeptide (TPR) repeat protein